MSKKYCYILIEGQYIVDVSQQADLPININKTLATANLDDSGSGGVFTVNFSVPASKNNIKIMKRLFAAELDVPSTLVVDDKPSEAAPSAGYPLRNAELIVNGMPSYKGQIALINGKSNRVPTSYDFTFYGDNGDWITRIKGKMLNELNFYDDDGNEKKILFTFNQMDADNASFPTTNPYWCFPLISYGAFGSYIFNPENTVDSGSEVNTNNPGLVGSADLRPALSIRQIIKEIFRQFNYKVESEFLDGNFFRRLLLPFGIGDWIIKEKREQAKEYKAGLTYHPGEGANSQDHIAVMEENGVLLGGDEYTRFAQRYDSGKFVEDYDPQDMFKQHEGEHQGDDNTWQTAYFEVPETGLYNINIDMFVTNVTDAPKESKRKNPYLQIVKDLVIDAPGRYVSGSILRRKEFSNDGTVALYGYGDTQNTPFNLTAGDKIYFHVYGGDYQKKKAFGIKKNTDDHFIRITGCTIQISFADQVQTGGNVIPDPIKISDTLPGDKQQIDFLRGVFHDFNLVGETDTQAKIVKIEPRNNVTCWDGFNGETRTYRGFYDYGLSPEDWSKYVDLSQDNIMEITTDLAKAVYLSYNGSQKYYTARFNFGRDFTKQEKDVKENPFFVPVLHVRDGSVSNYYNERSGTTTPVQPMYMPQMWDGDKDDEGNYPKQTFKHDPTILFWHGRGNMTGDYGQVLTDDLDPGTEYIRRNHWGMAYMVCYDDRVGITPSLSYCTEYLGKSFAPDDPTKWIPVKGLMELFYLENLSQLRDGLRLQVPLSMKELQFMTMNTGRLKQIFGRSYILEQFQNHRPTMEATTDFILLYAKPAEYLDYISIENGNDNDDDVNGSDDGVDDEPPVTPPDQDEDYVNRVLYFISYRCEPAAGEAVISLPDFEGGQVIYVDRAGSPMDPGTDYSWDTDTSEMSFTAPLAQYEIVNIAIVQDIDSTTPGYDGWLVKDYTHSGAGASIIPAGSPDYDLVYVDRNASELYPWDEADGYTDYDKDTGDLTLVTPIQEGETIHFAGSQFFDSENLTNDYVGVFYRCLSLAGENTITLSALSGCKLLLFKRSMYDMKESDYTYGINTGTIQFANKLNYGETIALIGHKTINR